MSRSEFQKKKLSSWWLPIGRSGKRTGELHWEVGQPETSEKYRRNYRLIEFDRLNYSSDIDLNIQGLF